MKRMPVIFIAALLTACHGSDVEMDDDERFEDDLADEVNEGGDSSKPVQLFGTHWQLVSYGYYGDELTFSVDGSRHTLLLEAQPQRVAGLIDCNEFESNISLNGNELRFLSLELTERQCELTGALHEQQNAFIGIALQSMQGYDLDGGRLRLLGADGSQLIYEVAVD